MSSSPYAPAAKILNQIWTQRQQNLKSLAYNRKGELTCTKHTYAQCAQVLKCKHVLDEIISQQEQKSSSKLEAKNEGLLYVLLYELLLGPNKAIRGGGALKRQIMKVEDSLRESMESLKSSLPKDCYTMGKESHTDDGSRHITIPRYVRVNTCRTTMAHIISHLQKKGMTEIYLDQHVPNVLVLPPTPKCRELLQDFVLKHEVVLQDKSSCFSALCLVHGFSGPTPTTYLDACAAPGNKTSHLAALLGEASSSTSMTNGKIGKSTLTTRLYALDKSPTRFQLLERRMNELTGTNVQENQKNKEKSTTKASMSCMVQCYPYDFFEVSAHSTSSDSSNKQDQNHRWEQQVEALLLDPSCSGSGMAQNHQENNRNPYFVNDRIQQLSNFQFKALLHATNTNANSHHPTNSDIDQDYDNSDDIHEEIATTTPFPKLKRIVYSTCSLYWAENEGVVSRFLYERGDEWSLVAPTCLDTWKRRGLSAKGLAYEEKDSATTVKTDMNDESLTMPKKGSPSIILTKEQRDALIRVHPDEDASNGFFVACFERKSKSASKTQSESSNKKKGSKSTSSTSTGISQEAALHDIPLYDNEFHKMTLIDEKNFMNSEKEGSNELKKNNDLEPSTKPNSKKKRQSSDDENDTTANTKQQTKKKQKKSNSREDSKTTPQKETVVSKKIAKKLQWKRKQRERKESRLQKKALSTDQA